MPAVSVDHSPPFLPCPNVARTARIRPVRSITTAPAGFEGEGFPVRRAFAGVNLADLDPFIHMDQMGEVDYGPGEPRGTAWHPHRGFETVTYMIDGVFQHKDSTGGGGLSITNGDTQWMTRGGGILHIERPPESMVDTGGLFHGIQLWVNLPSKDKMVTPRYQDIRSEKVTLLSSPDGGALVRIIAGDVAGHPGPGMTHTPIALVHATVAPFRSARPALAAAVQRGCMYALSGRGSIADDVPLAAGQFAVLGAGDRDPHRGRSDAGQPHTELRRARPRGPAHPRAGSGVRTVHEHPRRARGSVRGLPGRATRTRAGRRRRLTHRRRTRGRTGGRRGRA